MFASYTDLKIAKNMVETIKKLESDSKYIATRIDEQISIFNTTHKIPKYMAEKLKYDCDILRKTISYGDAKIDLPDFTETSDVLTDHLLNIELQLTTIYTNLYRIKSRLSDLQLYINSNEKNQEYNIEEYSNIVGPITKLITNIIKCHADLLFHQEIICTMFSNQNAKIEDHDDEDDSDHIGNNFVQELIHSMKKTKFNDPDFHKKLDRALKEVSKVCINISLDEDDEDE